MLIKHTKDVSSSRTEEDTDLGKDIHDYPEPFKEGANCQDQTTLKEVPKVQAVIEHTAKKENCLSVWPIKLCGGASQTEVNSSEKCSVLKTFNWGGD